MALRATVKWVSASAQDYKIKASSASNKFFTDSFVLSEIVAVALSRTEGDNFAFTDVTLFNTSKNVTGDSFGFTDNLVASINFNRFFNDSITLTDFLANSGTGSSPQDTFGLNELLDYHLFKGVNDSFTFAETVTSVINKIETDNFGLSDVPILQPNLNKVESFGLSDIDTRLISKGESDNFGLIENVTASYNYFFTDGFTLDDTLQVDKDVIQFKENVFSFSDTISITRTQGRALGNMVLGSKQFN